jgi:hypothetical protein
MVAQTTAELSQVIVVPPGFGLGLALPGMLVNIAAPMARVKVVAKKILFIILSFNVFVID